MVVPSPSDFDAAAARVMERIDALAAISETDDGLTTRTFGSAAMGRANALVGAWMRSAGLSVRVDGIGNLRGVEPRDGRPLLLLGSHLDTVREAGRFDGPLGVLAAVASVEAARAFERPYRLGVVGFSDEEGVRFGNSYLGSDVLAGNPFDASRFALADADGVTMAQAIRDLGGDPDALGADRLDPAAEGGLLGYVETHLEQGPVLESAGLPVGIVTAIQGQSRFAFRFEGRRGHAGTVPMALRRDALAAAAAFILEVEAYASHEDGLVATVGQLDVRPGAGNVIPGTASGSLDIRSPDDGQRGRACQFLHGRAEAIASERGLPLGWQIVQDTPATPCHPGLRARLAQAVAAAGFPVHELPSGAGHDPVALAAAMPVAMLFVRCKDGLSHHPLEAVAAEDIAAALKVMDKFLRFSAQSAGF